MAPAEPEGMKDTIRVSKERGKGKNTKEGFAASNITARTPPQATTEPAPPPGPSKPANRPPSTMTFTDTEYSESDELEEPKPKNLIYALTAVRDKLNKQNTSGKSLAIKTEVMRELDGIIQQMEQNSLQSRENTTEADRISSIENDLKEIKAALKDAITTKTKTYAEAACNAGSGTSAMDRRQKLETEKKQRMEKLKREREKTEVALTTRNASENMKTKLANMNEAEIMKQIQQGMQQAGKDPTKICGVKNTPNHGLKIRCTNQENAEEVRKLDWNQALEGASTIEQTFGLVLHGVTKYDIDLDNHKPDEIKARIEYANYETITVEKVIPLRRRNRNPTATTHSIVIFTKCPKEADECIENGINIEHRHYQPERYLPQCQIRQCFKCQGYGHRASTCTRKTACGKCAQEHETKNCESETTKCAQCKGPHAAWHYECPARQRETERMETIKDALSPFYTS